jgi:hypothetical protein
LTRHRWPDRCGYATYPPIPGDEETLRRVGPREAAERLAAAGLRDCTHEARALEGARRPALGPGFDTLDMNSSGIPSRFLNKSHRPLRTVPPGQTAREHPARSRKAGTSGPLAGAGRLGAVERRFAMQVGNDNRTVAIILSGGPADIPDDARVHHVDTDQEAVKLPHRGGYEHFVRDDAVGLARDEPIVFRWTMRTEIAE